VSYDLAVFTSDRPELPADPGGCEVDGPLAAEDEDAPPIVAAALLRVRWTVQISMPASRTRRDVKAVERFSRAVADSGRGVVYDPQADAIVWPRNPAKLRAVDAVEHGDERVELQWLFARRLTAADAHALLAVLRDAIPEAVPVRFGDYEPMQGKLDRDGDDAFAALWDGESDPFWNGRPPVEYGFVGLHRGFGAALPPAEREALIPTVAGRRAIAAHELSIEFFASVAGDPRWLDAIVALFARVADELGAFFAGAFHNEREVALNGRFWLGLPPDALWLAWLGPAYREAIGKGPLLRAADRPDDFRAIKRARPAWPKELVRRGDQLDVRRAAATIPAL
jgi:hypothetical protein